MCSRLWLLFSAAKHSKRFVCVASCEPLSGGSSTAAANSEQCRSFTSVLRTSLQPRCTTAALVTSADCQTHKVQIMRSDVWRFPYGTAPAYLTDLCSRYRPPTIRSSVRGNFVVRRTRKDTVRRQLVHCRRTHCLELNRGSHPDDWLALGVLPSPKNLSVHCSWLYYYCIFHFTFISF